MFVTTMFSYISSQQRSRHITKGKCVFNVDVSIATYCNQSNTEKIIQREFYIVISVII